MRRLLPLLIFLLTPAAHADRPLPSTPAAVVQHAAVDQQRLPRILLHGSALTGPARKLTVEEIDRLALLTTWNIDDPYKRQKSRYTGILLKDFVAALAPKATHLRMRAVNDYVTTFARTDWETLPILLATRDADARMSVADKGPVRIIFLQNSTNEMAMQVHAPKWIWQVVDVEFQSR